MGLRGSMCFQQADVVVKGEWKVATGLVKWFDDAKGYGFITREDGTDVFVHYSAIQMRGHKTLVEGQEVQYEYRQGDRGLLATTVVPS